MSASFSKIFNGFEIEIISELLQVGAVKGGVGQGV
jgi:hypothetical protein